MIGIYAIRNKVNGKVYVGQSRNIQKRFKQHLDALERGVHHSKKLQEDFEKFGADKFVLELLELCPSDQLDQKEMEWITKFDALQNGYNTQDPSTRKTWFGFKREKRPGISVRGELSRVLREFALETIEDFRKWLEFYKDDVQEVLAALAWVVLAGVILTVLIAIGYLVFKFFGGFALLLYILFTAVGGAYVLAVATGEV